MLAELEWRRIDYVLHKLRVVPIDQLHKVVFPRELYILELREVCDIESRTPMHSDLRLRVTSLKIDAILVKGLLRPESGHVEEVVLRQLTFERPDVILDMVRALIVFSQGEVCLDRFAERVLRDCHLSTVKIALVIVARLSSIHITVIVVLVRCHRVVIRAIVFCAVVMLHEQKLLALHEVMRTFEKPDVESYVLVGIVLVVFVEVRGVGRFGALS